MSASPNSNGIPRALAPDLARGLMLLLIALANVGAFLYGRPLNIVGQIQVSGFSDQVAVMLRAIFVDQRALPLFAFLLGYSMVQFTNSRYRRGYSSGQITRMLYQRHWAMLVFGLLHAALLFGGDILGTYAIVALVWGTAFFSRSNRSIKLGVIVLVAIYFLNLLLSLLLAFLPSSQSLDLQEANTLANSSATAISYYPAALLARLNYWFHNTPLSALFAFNLIIMVLCGWLAGRSQMLEGAKKAWLIGTAAWSLPLAWAGGVGQGLVALGLFDTHGSLARALIVLSGFTGMAGALGYVCLFALASNYFSPRDLGLTVRAIVALGKRSLSGYLLQSIFFAFGLSTWSLGWGKVFSLTQALVFAVIVWIFSLILAYVLELKAWRGPFEIILRFFTYLRVDQDGGRKKLDPTFGEA